MSLKLFFKLFFGIFFDLGLGLATGAALTFAVGFGILETLLLEEICPSLTFWQVQAVGVLVDESEHAIAELYDYEEESQRERLARARALARQHPNNVYLFGDFSIYDGLALGASAYVVAQTELPETVFKYTAGLLDRS